MADGNRPPQGVPQTILELMPDNPAARDNPHALLKALRETCPVMRDETIKTWLLTRYRDIRETSNDRSFVRHPSKAEPGTLAGGGGPRDGQEPPPEAPLSMLFLDDPDHSRVRLPIAKAFYARIHRMRPDIEAMIDSVIEAAPLSGRFDLMELIAVPIPILVIARILGVDEDRLVEFRKWSEQVILGLKPARTPEEDMQLFSGGMALMAYFTELMEARRAAPRDDLVTDLVQMQASGEAELRDEELRSNLLGLLVGGNLTTTDLIGNGIWLFLTHPEQAALLRAHPQLASQAVEEVLRYEAPVTMSSRIVPDARTVGGCPMSKGQPVWMMLPAANRDPEIFEAPEVFDISIKRTGHVAFGGGSHICIGAPLARIEARQVYLKLLTRYPNLRLPEQALAWRPLPFFRGLETLIVEA